MSQGPPPSRFVMAGLRRSFEPAQPVQTFGTMSRGQETRAQHGSRSHEEARMMRLLSEIGLRYNENASAARRPSAGAVPGR